MLTKLEQFFYDNHWADGMPQQDRVQDATALARAVHHAAEHGWRYSWDTDPDGCDCEPADDFGVDHTVEYCLLQDASNGNLILGSLSGICGATEQYRRIVEAELALEAMTKQ